MKNFLKLAVNALVIFVLISSAWLLMASQTSAATLKAGDLIKSADYPAVYYYAADGKRYVFPNQKTYNTWYKDFSNIVTVTSAELAAIPIGGNITYRAGTKLIKITTDPKVYAVSPNSQLHAIDSETRAKTLYGENWAKLVEDVSDAFFVNYNVGTAINSDQHPDGTIIKYANGNQYVIQSGKKRLFVDNSFTDNYYDSQYLIETNLDYPDGTQVKERESSLADPIELVAKPCSTGAATNCGEETVEPEKVAFIIMTSNYSQLAANTTDVARIDFILKNEKGEIATTYNSAVTVTTNDLLKPSTYSTKATNGLGSVIVTASYKTGKAEIILSVGEVNKLMTIDVLSVELLQPGQTMLKDLSLLTPAKQGSGSGEEFAIPFNAITGVDYYIAEASNLENFNNIVAQKEIQTASCQNDTCYVTFSFSNPNTQTYFFRV
ncbi:MAG: hypothetical protein V1692_01115, partial [bacterium]